MLIIRTDQLTDLRKERLVDFENRLLLHIAEIFPEKLASWGDARMREIIQQGVNESARYSLVRERDVGLYVDLLIGFGQDFLDQERLSFIRPILDNRRLGGDQKIDAIYEQLSIRLSPGQGVT